MLPRTISGCDVLHTNAQARTVLLPERDNTVHVTVCTDTDGFLPATRQWGESDSRAHRPISIFCIHVADSGEYATDLRVCTTYR